jgi:hypothetical protein
MRERLKEAKGIGTPATRAEIIKGLKRQNLLAADGKLLVPTEAGLQLFELLRGAAAALVDPGTTAEWEMQLDAVVTGQAEFKTVIDGIAAEALALPPGYEQDFDACRRFLDQHQQFRWRLVGTAAVREVGREPTGSIVECSSKALSPMCVSILPRLRPLRA